MPRRIEIELTSARPDGSWTWRAAGAREPKGVLDGSLLHDAAKPGDVLKAEADFELEGITILSVMAPKADNRTGAQRIEIIGSGRPEGPPVTAHLAGRSDRRPGDRRRDRDDGRPRPERANGRPPSGRDSGQPRRDGGAPRSKERDEASAGAESAVPSSLDEGGGAGHSERAGPDRRDRAPRGRTDRPRTDRPGGERPAGRGRPARRDEHESDEGRAGRDRRPSHEQPSDRAGAGADRRRGRRLNPGTTHRQAVMDSLPPEQQAVAEQVLRGGIPAVRTALHLEREKAASEGRPAPNTDQLIAMAEELLPRLKAAEWRDRAEAAAADVDGISLRDLRAVVAGADVARDDETRALGAQLREALERRVTALHQEWAAEIIAHLDDNRLVRAIRLSSRPPDPAARLDAELSQRLADAAGRAMSPETSAERWASLLEAVAASPIRRNVQPVGLPADAPADLKRAAHQQSGSIPALAKLLGVTIPPPPRPSAAPRRRGDAGPRPHRDPGARPVPPAPAAGEGGAPAEASEPAAAEGSETPVAPEASEAATAEGSEAATEASEPAAAEGSEPLAAEGSETPVAAEASEPPATEASETAATEASEHLAAEPAGQAEPEPAPEPEPEPEPEGSVN